MSSFQLPAVRRLSGFALTPSANGSPAPHPPESKSDESPLKPEITPSTTTDVHEVQTLPAVDIQRDDPMFNANAGADTVEYKNMSWLHAVLIMIAETISLGILSLPSALATLGLAGGCTLIVGLGILAGYTGIVYGQFKLRHPNVVTMGDAGEILAGKWGREILGWAATLVLVFIMAAHITSFGVMMNVLTNHGTCTIAWYILGTVISVVACLPRTMKSVSFLSISSCMSIIIAVIVAMVAVGVTSPRPGNVHITLEGDDVAHRMIPVLNIVIAYAGHVAFFNIISEMRRPQDFPKAMCLLQVVATSFYLLCAVVIYWFVGPNVPSPALSAAPPLIRKVAYGLASLTIVVAGVVNGHIAVKYCYLRFWEMRGKHAVIFEKSWRARGSWWIITVTAWAVAWILAEAIPSFNHILALVSALFCGWFSYGLSGFFWLSLNRGSWTAGWRKRCVLVVNVLVISCGAIICCLGLYATGKSMADGEAGAAFSCADNAGAG